MDTELTQDEKTTGMICHLLSFAGYVVPFGNIIGPLVAWLIKKKESEFVDDNGKQVLNFQISITIWSLLCIPLLFIFIGFVLLIALVIIDLVCTVKAAITAHNGEVYQYPISIRFIK